MLMLFLGAAGGAFYWLDKSNIRPLAFLGIGAPDKEIPRTLTPAPTPPPPAPAPPVIAPTAPPDSPAGQPSIPAAQAAVGSGMKSEREIRAEVEAEIRAKAEADRIARLAAAKAKVEREKYAAAEKKRADTEKAKADADRLAAQMAAAQANPGRPASPAATPPAQVVRSPQEACADRPNFISREICLSRECERPEKAGLAFCRERIFRTQSPGQGASNSAP